MPPLKSELDRDKCAETGEVDGGEVRCLQPPNKHPLSLFIFGKSHYFNAPETKHIEK